MILRNVVTVLAAVVVAGCKTECVAGTGCGGPVTYAVAIQAAPANLGAVTLSIDTKDQTTVSVVAGRAVPGQLSGTGARRAIIIGAPQGSTMATILFSSIPAQGPTVLVTGAAANQAGGYQPIPATAVQLSVSEKQD
jgi:hypothetical protein